MHESVIITDVSGFIGRSLAEFFLEQGADVTGLSIDTVSGTNSPVRVLSIDEKSISSLVASVKPSVFIHAAGSASVGESITNPARDYANSSRSFPHRARKSPSVQQEAYGGLYLKRRCLRQPGDAAGQRNSSVESYFALWVP